MKNFDGKVLFLDRADINTDEIIPARYLTEIKKEALKPHLLEDLCMDGFLPERDLTDVRAIVTRDNFGCGSSREHAPWALELNDVHLVIAPSFARIFRQNMFNCGMMAVELPAEQIDGLFRQFSGLETQIATRFDPMRFTFTSAQGATEADFSISEFDRALVEAGGWVDYADARY
jgi:3-isopropylmalate/(R)-2-methylmalate dehydratase small subunit